jgi:ketosteroid isomerase-like protein
MGSTDSDRAEVLVRAIEATMAGDSTLLGMLYTEAVDGWSPSMSVSSAAELAVELEKRDTAFSDIDLEVAPLEVGGDQACVEWVATATHSGALMVDDVVIEATGRRVTVRGVTVAEFDGGRICAFRQYYDEVALLAHLGLLPVDDLSSL